MDARPPSHGIGLAAATGAGAAGPAPGGFHCGTRAHQQVSQRGELGRPYSFTDDALATSNVDQASVKGCALHVFIHALVASDAFHSK